MHPVMHEREYVNVVSGSAAGCFSDLLALKRFGRVEKHVLQLADSQTAPGKAASRDCSRQAAAAVKSAGASAAGGATTAPPVAASSAAGTTPKRTQINRVAAVSARKLPPPPPPTTRVPPAPASSAASSGPPSAEFGYNIGNVAEFLSRATLSTPANIPMVVTSVADLYVSYPSASTSSASSAPTVPLNLGLVLNALFRVRQWLFVQTPHSQEGYVACSACSPLGVLPSRSHNPSALSSPPVADTTTTVSAKSGLTTTAKIAAAARGAACRARLSPPNGHQQQQHRRHQSQQLPAQQQLAVVPRQQQQVAPPSPPPPLQFISGPVRTNCTDAEKMYANLTADGRAIGLEALHVRCAPSSVRVGSDAGADFHCDWRPARRVEDDELHTQSADERGTRARRHTRARHRSVHETVAARAGCDDQTVRTAIEKLRHVSALHATPSTPSPSAAALGLSVPHLAVTSPARANRPSAFQPLRPTAKSMESVRAGRAESAAASGATDLILVPAGTRQVRAPRANNKAVVVQRFEDAGRPHTLSVRRGDIVILLNTSMGDWYWVQNASGCSGYIPRCCVRGDVN